MELGGHFVSKLEVTGVSREPLLTSTLSRLVKN